MSGGLSRIEVPVWDPQSRPMVCKCGAEYSQEKKSAFGLWSPLACAPCLALELGEAEVEAAREREVARSRMAAQRLERLAPPDEFRHATLDNFEYHGEPKDKAISRKLVARARTWCAQVLDDPRTATPLVVLYGPPGTGKSHVAWSMALTAAVLCGVSVKAGKFPAIIRRLQGGWGAGDGDSTPEWKRLQEFQEASVLFIDEISVHAITQKTLHPILYELLGTRAEHRRPTICTTNETGQGLADVFGAALVDRITGCGGWWDAGTRSYRREVMAGRRRGTVPGNPTTES